MNRSAALRPARLSGARSLLPVLAVAIAATCGLVARPRSALAESPASRPAAAAPSGATGATTTGPRATASPASPVPRVVSFEPNAPVKQIRQIVARFATPMVALGDPRGAAAPFATGCPGKGSGRWLDSRTYAFDFETPLAGGVRCAFTLGDVTDREGRALTGERTFTVSTGGISILSSVPDADSTIDEDQAFLLVLDGTPSDADVERDAYFTAEGIADRIAARVVGGEARKQILATRPEWWKPKGPVVIVSAAQHFPAEAAVSLVWGRAITASGGQPSVDDQTFKFTVRPAFSASFRCQQENAHSNCVPLAPVSIQLSAPIAAADVAKIRLTSADGRSFAPDPPSSPDPWLTHVLFPAPFPESSTLQLAIDPGLKDDSGRPLSNIGEFQPMAVKMDPAPPLAKFPARFGILEAHADPALPVTIRDLEPEVKTHLLQLAGATAAAPTPVKGGVLRLPADKPAEVLSWLLRVSAARRDASVFGAKPPAGTETLTLPEPDGKAMQVVGIPLAKPGVYVVELESRRLGEILLDKKAPMYVPAAALVTNLAVHLQWGREGSLVWVTTLDDATPVAGAAVAVHDCGGKTLWQGSTDAQGIARIAALPSDRQVPSCHEPDEGRDYDPFQDSEGSMALRNMTSGLFVTARLGDDLSFVHSSWTNGIEPYRFNLPDESYLGPYAAHTILDRSLLRAGDTLHLKHVFRSQTLTGFGLANVADRPSRVELRHAGSDTHYQFPLTWADDGSAETTWTIPREAKLGRYEVVLIRPGARDASAGEAPQPTPSPKPPYASFGFDDHAYPREWTSGEFRLEEFRVPLLRATVKLPAEAQIAPREVPVDLGVQFLAGGSAGALPVVLRSRLVAEEVPSPEGFEGLSFGNGPVTPGVTRAELGDEEEGQPGAGKPAVFQRRELRLDSGGTARTSVSDLPTPSEPQKLVAELEFRDPNGEIQTAVGTTSLWPAADLVGIAADFRSDGKRRITARLGVLDAAQKPVAGMHVAVDAFSRTTYTSRKRVVGGFYAYEDVVETKRVKPFCRGRTDERGHFVCRRRTPADGEILLQARVTDGQGRASAAHADVWVPSAKEGWFQISDSDRMDVLPDKRRYEPGETAHLRVHMPFRRATALVTVAREGVLDATVQRLDGRDPMIDVPVSADFSPNMFVSVLAVRGRVGTIQPTAMVDLGKPAFKLGVAELTVGWKPHELDVHVASDRQAYRVREKAQVKIAVTRADGGALAPGSSVAVAAVDEGLLELLPNKSWELLPAMMGRRGFSLWTSTAQMQVVGKRHFGKKAVPSGGGGGRQMTRELFDTLLLWADRVPLGPDGTATVEVPLNDSLTSFRIAAIATAGTGEFGTGETTIRSTQDLMLLAGLPPVVRSGDSFRAELTVRNTTERALDVDVSGGAAGLDPLAPQSVALPAGEAKQIAWDVTAPQDTPLLRYDFSAAARGGPTDRLAVKQTVIPAVPVRTTQATIAQWAGQPMREPVAAPRGALPGQGGIDLTLSPSLIGSLTGVRDWMQRYPYTCLEQRVSRAIALGDPALWTSVQSLLPALQDGDGLLKYFATMEEGSEVLTAYVLEISRAAALELPPEVERKMKDGLRRFVSGELTRRAATKAADLPLRKMGALAALASAGAAEPSLVSGLTIEPALWPTGAVLDWWELLARTPKLPERNARLAQAQEIVRARLDLEGRSLSFRNEDGDRLWWLMANPDVNAVRLAWLVADTGVWPDDASRVMRGALARQQRGRWDGTVANAWGVVAATRFARAYEAQPIAGATSAALAGAAQELDWAKQPGGGELRFAWPAQEEPIVVEHRGSGRPWVEIQTRAAIPLEAPLANGFRLTRSVEPVEQKVKGKLSVGDVLRVRLTVEAQSSLTWVVLDDPIPAGASHLGRGLGGEAALDAATGASSAAGDPGAPGEAIAPTFVERSFEAYRAYFESVDAGRFTVEHRIRLNQAGRFQLPPTRVEALYAPEIYGEAPNPPVEVVP